MKPNDDKLCSLLSTEDGRTRRELTSAIGFWHEACVPFDPAPGETVKITACIGADIDVEQVWLDFTIDESDPRDSSSSMRVIMQREHICWNTAAWCYIESYSALIPAQNGGTRVRYCVSADGPSGRRFSAPWHNSADFAHSRVKDSLDNARIYHTFRRCEPIINEYCVDDLRTPDWWEDAIIYQLIPDRFAPDPGADWSPDFLQLDCTSDGGSYDSLDYRKRFSPASGTEIRSATATDEFCGGTLKGLLHRLDHIANLGANCIWMTPVFPSPSHHGYDCTDFGSIEPRLGSLDDWDALVNACHQRGIKILLDLAANHVSSEHPFFQAALESTSAASGLKSSEPSSKFQHTSDLPEEPALKVGTPNRVDSDEHSQNQGEHSPFNKRPSSDPTRCQHATSPPSYREWFRFTEWPHAYDSYAMIKEFPVLETENQQVRTHIIESCIAWLNRGCDGFRLDHAHGLSHGFWSQFRSQTRLAAQDSIMVGEVSSPPDSAITYAGRMDGILDFKLCELLRQFCAYQTIGPIEFNRQLLRHLQYFQGSLINPSFFDNHDMDRLLWIVAGDTRKVKLASILQFTLPGPPIIYYGTEIGLSQNKGDAKLEEARLPFPWSQAEAQLDEQKKSDADGAYRPRHKRAFDAAPPPKESTGTNLDLLDFYTRLVEIRKSAKHKWKLAERKTLITDDARGVFVFRVSEHVVAINNSATTNQLKGDYLSKSRCLLSSETAVLNQTGELVLPAYSGVILATRT